MAGGQTQGGNRGGSGGSSQRFYNEDVNIGGTPVSIATIILGGVVIFGMFGGTFASGLLSVYGFGLALFAVITWLVWSVRKDGVFSVVNQILTMVVAMLALIWFFFSFVPEQFNKVDMTEWNTVFANFNANVDMNSPLSNPVMVGVEVWDNVLETSTDPNNGGGSTVYSTPLPLLAPTTVDVTPVPYIPPTPNPTTALTVELNRAIENNNNAMVLEVTGQILTIDPNHAQAKVWNEKVITEQIHASNLANMPQPPNGFMRVVREDERLHAVNILGSNGEMRDGYTYIVVDNGAKATHVSCNELAILELTNGFYAGTQFTTQRCLITVIAGSSDNGTVFKVR